MMARSCTYCPWVLIKRKLAFNGVVVLQVAFRVLGIIAAMGVSHCYTSYGNHEAGDRIHFVSLGKKPIVFVCMVFVDVVTAACSVCDRAALLADAQTVVGPCVHIGSS